MKNQGPGLQYGLYKNNKLVHISEVENGLNCDCYCPYCHERLIARQGEKNRHSFAHVSGKECPNAPETALHMLAKEIISKGCNLTIPAVIFRKKPMRTGYKGSKIVLHESYVFRPDKVELETKLEGFTPDIIAEQSGEQLAIEIRVTHKVDEEKREKIKKRNISTIEIDLSSVDRDIYENDLKYYLETGELTSWVFHKDIEKMSKVSNSLSIKNLRDLQVYYDSIHGEYIEDPPCEDTDTFIAGKPIKCIENCKKCSNFYDYQKGISRLNNQYLYCKYGKGHSIS